MSAVSGGAVWFWPVVGAIGGGLSELGEALEDGEIQPNEVVEICGGMILGAVGGRGIAAVGKAAKAAKSTKKKGG